MTQLICGILRLDDVAPDEVVVRRMAAAMIAPGLRHRTEIAVRGRAAFAATRIALRGAAEDPGYPSILSDGDTLLAADITIYDRARMPIPGVGDAAPDLEFLRAALRQRSDRAFGDLHGDFALAAFRDGCLTLARDHFGSRPLVYVERPGRYLAFASSPAALLQTGLASPDLDEPVAASWILQSSPPPGRTIYREIVPVDAAHVVECQGGQASARRYWRLDTSRRLPFNSDQPDLATETARLLKQAVERRLPLAGPGAGHLSGGLDSSPVAVLAARALAQTGRRFFAYTFTEPVHGPGLVGTGDAPVAARVAAAEPAITEIPIESPSLLATYAEGVDPDTLLPISAADPEEQILRHAAALGAGVILSGWGGDQIVSYHGRGAEAELFRAGRLLRLWRQLRAESSATGVDLARLFRSTVVVQGLPRGLRRRLREIAGRASSYDAAIAQRSRLAAGHRRNALLVEELADYGTTHEIRRSKAEAWYIQTRLAAFAHQGARHGVIYAYPLLDLDLIEFSIQVPGIFLRSGGRRRLLLRQALEGILPDEVRLQPEKLRPFPGEALRNAALRDTLLDIVAGWRKQPPITDLLDLDFVSEMIRHAGDPDLPDDLEIVDLTPAFQIGALVTALEQRIAECEPADATP